MIITVFKLKAKSDIASCLLNPLKIQNYRHLLYKLSISIMISNTQYKLKFDQNQLPQFSIAQSHNNTIVQLVDLPASRIPFEI